MSIPTFEEKFRTVGIYFPTVAWYFSAASIEVAEQRQQERIDP
jgi:hypothetical protein